MTTYLIIDDEQVSHDIIKGYCDKLPNLSLAASCYDAFEALEFLSNQSVNLIFLDINMPKLKGFEFLKSLSHTPQIIVTTAYSEYAVEGYELDIVDYLLKPFGFDRFLKAINKALQSTDVEATFSEDKVVTPGESHIFIYCDKQYIQVNQNKLLYAEAAGNYVKVITTESVYLEREKISELLLRLSSDKFIRVHKSFIVSRAHIERISGDRIFVADYSIPIGKMYRSNVDQLIK